jgi:hypothetical protein
MATQLETTLLLIADNQWINQPDIMVLIDCIVSACLAAIVTGMTHEIWLKPRNFDATVSKSSGRRRCNSPLTVIIAALIPRAERLYVDSSNKYGRLPIAYQRYRWLAILVS